MTTSPDLSIARGIAELIAEGISPALVPTTTIKTGQPATAGQTTVYLTSTAGFIKGGRFDVWDGTTERGWSIAEVDSTAGTVTLNTAGLSQYGYTGLQFDHAAGALVTTNLMSFEAVKIAHMLGGDWPAILVYALKSRDQVSAQRKSTAAMQYNVDIRRTILKAEDNPIDDNDWVELQQERIRQDLQTIKTLLEPNRHLTTSQGPLALGLGDGNGLEFDRAWGRLPIAADNDQYCGVLTVYLRAKPESF